MMMKMHVTKTHNEIHGGMSNVFQFVTDFSRLAMLFAYCELFQIGYLYFLVNHSLCYHYSFNIHISFVCIHIGT